MTKITARHRAPLSPRGRLTRLWSTVSALPVGALAGCVAVGAAAATSSPEVGALGLGVAMAPAAFTSWRSRFTEPAAGHGRRSVRAAARSTGEEAAATPLTPAGRRVERTLAPRPATVSLASLLEAPRAVPAAAAAPAPAVAEVLAPRRAGQRAAASPFGPVAAGTLTPRPVTDGPVTAGPVTVVPTTMLALGTTTPSARTPIVLDVPDLAALHAATGQEHVWHGRSATRPEDDPARLFTVSSSGGAVEVVVLTRAERAARDLEALSAMAAAEESAGEDAQDAAASEPAPPIMVRLPGGRAAARGRRRAAEDDGLASAA